MLKVDPEPFGVLAVAVMVLELQGVDGPISRTVRPSLSSRVAPSMTRWTVRVLSWARAIGATTKIATM